MKCIITKHDNKNFYPGWMWMGKKGKYMSKVIDEWMEYKYGEKHKAK